MLFVQWSVVVLLVAVSAVYSVWRLLGVRQRLWLIDQLMPMAQLAHLGWPGRVKASLQMQALKGCASCGSNADAVPTRRSDAPRH